MMRDLRFDPFELKILAALQEDGRLTSQDLAARVGLSASQCARRRAALEASGAIAGYQALLSAEALGLELIAFVEIALAAHSAGAAERVASLLRAMPEVQEAYTLTGDTDYLVKLAVRDLKALSEVLNNRLLTHDGVARLRSSIVLDRLKQTNALPLDHLRSETPRV